MEEIYLFSLPVKEYQIVDHFLPKLKDEVMKIMPVQKQTRAGQRTRFKAFVAIGDMDGHVGSRCQMRKGGRDSHPWCHHPRKTQCRPVRKGYWGAALGDPHTVPTKVSGEGRLRHVSSHPRAPWNRHRSRTRIQAHSPTSWGSRIVTLNQRVRQRTMGNFIKATFVAVSNLPFN